MVGVRVFGVMRLLSPELQTQKRLSLRRVPAPGGHLFGARAGVELKEKRLVIRFRLTEFGGSGIVVLHAIESLNETARDNASMWWFRQQSISAENWRVSMKFPVMCGW